jgi:formate dehydrogenase subunit delta
MNIDHLIKMANEIGFFFEAESPPEQAPRDVANHLKRFWEPRMRRDMIAHYARGGAGLTDLAREAVAILAGDPAGTAGAASGAGTPAAGTAAPKSG